MKKHNYRLLAGLMSLCLLLCLLPAVPAFAQEQLEIGAVALSGISVPQDGQYAVLIPSSDIQLQMPEAYQVVEDSICWKEQYGKVIDHERYAFEAGRTYYLEMTLRVTNPDNYSFASKVSATLADVSSSAYTSRVSYPAQGEILVQFGFTLEGSRTYPDVTEIYLTGQTEPVMGEKPLKDFTVPYGNFALLSATWDGELADGKFLGGKTYALTVELTSFTGYHFSKDAVIRLDGKKPTSVTVSRLTNNGKLTAIFEYYVSTKKEVGNIIINGGLQRPVAGTQNRGVLWHQLELPYAAEYKIKNQVYGWTYSNDKVIPTGQRFRYGVTYSIQLSFTLKDPDTRVFSRKPNIYVQTMPDWMYDTRVVKSEANELVVEILVKAVFSGSEGFTRENPVRCYSFEDLKGALESTTIHYVSLMDVPSGVGVELPSPPKGSEDQLFYFIMSHGTKELCLDGDAVFSSTWKEQPGYNKIGGLIYNPGNLTVTGEGSLTYLAPVSSGYNAVIVNRGNLTVESGTLEGYVEALKYINTSGQITDHDKHACAIYQHRNAAKLTINGGTFLTKRYVEQAAGQAAVIVDGGTVQINGGTFDYDVRYGLKDAGCYGLLIKSADAKVTIGGGSFRNIYFYDSVALTKYIPSNRKVKVNNVPQSLTDIKHQLLGDVRVCPLVQELSVHINAPNAGENPSFEAYVTDGVAQVHGGTKGIEWIDVGNRLLLPADKTFIPGHIYMVTIKLEVTDPNLFAVDSKGEPAIKATINYQPVLVTTVDTQSAERVVQLSYISDICPAELNHVDVTVQPPFEGRTIPSSVDFETGGVELFGLDWEDKTADRFMNPGETFIQGHSYQVQVWIKAANGYAFKVDQNLDPAVTGTLNGDTVKVGRAHDQSADEVVRIVYDFGVCDTEVDFVNVLNLDIPQPNALPDFGAAVQHRNQYEIEHIRWTGPEGALLENDRFRGGEEYTVEIKLVPICLNGLPLYSFRSGLQAYLNTQPIDSGDIFASAKAVYIYRNYTCPETAATATLSGSITASLNASDPVALKLSNDSFTYEIISTDGSYRFDLVPLGTYTLTVSKKDHVTKTYTIVLDGNLTRDIVLTPISGQVSPTFTGLYKVDGSWYYFKNGTIATELTTLVKYNNEWWYVVKGKVASDTTSLVKYNGEWWYVVKGKIASNTTSLVKYNNEWWYVVKGKIASQTTSLVKYNNEWWYVVKGKIAGNTTSLVKYSNEWWYVVKGKIAGNTTGLVKYSNEWWYVVKGKVASNTTTLVKYNNEWWYVVKGKVASGTTALVQYNGGWYYMVKGKLAAKTTTLVKYNGAWYYIKNGAVDWSYTGTFFYNGKTYNIKKGRVV